MKGSRFGKVIQEVLGPVMGPLDFTFEQKTFFRELPSDVLHLVGFEFDPRTTETFRVLCGANTRRIPFYASKHPSEMGFIGAQHLTPTGWDINSGHWPCSDEQEARTSLAKIGALIPTVVEPWFEKHQTLSSVAEHMDTQHPRQGLDKARLYLADGNLALAESTLHAFIEVLEHPKPWNDPKELSNFKSQAQILLAELTVV